MPPSVRFAFIVDCLILGTMLLLALLFPAADTAGAFMAPPLVAAVHAVALAGVLTRGRWAWFYVTTLFGIWVLAFVVIAVFSMARLPDAIQSIPSWLTCCFLGWLLLSLALGKPARSFPSYTSFERRMRCCIADSPGLFLP